MNRSDTPPPSPKNRERLRAGEVAEAFFGIFLSNTSTNYCDNWRKRPKKTSRKDRRHGIGMSTDPWWVGLEFCDLLGQGPDTNWVPAVHAKTDGAPVIYDWPSFGFATYGSEGSAIRELKMAVKSNYQIWFYLDSVRLQRFDKDNYIQWNSNALGLTRAESAYEIGSDLTSAPHQTANHHYGWAYQRWIGDTAWPLQTPDCSRDELYWDFQYDPAVQHRPGAYPYALWIVNPWWDWMARGWL
jgi:hypothetical protein